MNPKDKRVVIGEDGKVTSIDIPPSPPAPRTPEEIMAAKAYLREAFVHAVENLDALLAAPEEQRLEAVKRRILKERGMTDAEIDARDAEARQGLQEMAREVAKGTPRGEDLLDQIIEVWRFGGGLPSFLRKPPKP